MKKLVTLILWLLAMVASLNHGICEAAEKQWCIEREGVKVTFGGKNWLDIEVDGIPFSNYSELWVVNKNWSHYYFGYTYDKKLRQNVQADDSGLTITLRGEYEEFLGEQKIELLPGRVLRNTVRGHLTTDTVARLNYVISSIQPGWVAGCSYRSTSHDGQTTSGVFPLIAPKMNLETAVIQKHIKHLEIDSKLGLIQINASGNLPLSCLDYRNNAWDNPDYHLLLGMPDFWFEGTKDIDTVVDVVFPQSIPQKQGLNGSQSISVMSKKNVLREDVWWDVVLPTPKKLTWGSGMYPLGRSVRIVTDQSTSDRDSVKQICQRLTAHLKQKGLESKISNVGKADILLQLDKKAADGKNGGYRIVSNRDGVVLSYTDKTGLDNAEKTLRQLLRSENGSLGIRCVEIEDFPSLPFRGIHCFSGKNALPVQTKFFDFIFPTLKINNLIYECSYLEWDSLPVLRNKTNGMRKADLKKLIKLAQTQMLEIIPMVNTFGHSEWLLGYPETKQYADDPEKIYAYDATNPRVYEICEAIYSECIDLFQPKILHIGHDEIQGRDFPKRDEGKKIGAAELILKDTLHWYEFLKKKNVRTMMWGDMLLYMKESPDAVNASSQEEAERLRSLLPKDIMISDWHYAPAAPAAYKSLGIFNAAGFDAIAAPWNTPENMVNFTRAAKNAYDNDSLTTGGRTLGTVQTTWAGYNFNAAAIAGARQQFACYVLAAELAWNGAMTEPDLLPYSFQEAFTRLYGDSKLTSKNCDGWYALISGDVTLKDLGVMNTVPARGNILTDRLNWDVTKLTGIALTGCFSDLKSARNEYTVSVQNKAEKILFVVTTPFSGSQAKPIATTVCTYEDGSTETISWKIGENILSLNDHRDLPSIPTVARFVGHGSTPSASLHGYLWEPRSSKKVMRSLHFMSTETGPGMVIFGIVGFNGGK